MISHRFSRSAILLIVFPAILSAQTSAADSDWLETLRNLPLTLRSALTDVSFSVSKFSLAAAAPICSVAPLPGIEDPDALSFERESETSSAVDLAGLRPAMANALDKFRHMVLAVGGTFDLKSAYRPPAYQEHLQQVWFKWMELRRNREAGCQMLRAEVADEFSRHHLMESQKPVSASDHTLGLAFDAAVVLPRMARLQHRRVTLDRLAVLAGLRRPDILRDPVHFKLVIGRGIRG